MKKTITSREIIRKKKRLWRVGKEELRYVKRAIDGGLTGEMTKILETRFAEKFNVSYAIAVNSGTSALHCALGALKIGRGDEVIVPPLTFAATAFCALYVGAIPVFADVNPETWNIDPREIEKKITPRTKAIIAVSLYGLPVDIQNIMAIARQHHLKVVEDDAQCVLGRYGDKTAGSVADISIFSFQRSKHITTGDGGMITTNDENLALGMRKFGDLGYTTLTAKPISNENFKERIQSPNFLRHDMAGFNFRMPEVCAAMGLAQLEKLDMLVNKRIAIAKLYEKAVEGCRWLTPQVVPAGFRHSYWTYVLKLDERKIPWADFRRVFRDFGGEPFYAAWQLTYREPFFKKTGFSTPRCPVAESLQPFLIQLKTNFKDLSYAARQAAVLRKTIEKFGR